MAEEQYTVFFGQKDAGSIKPLTGWTAKQLKVAKISDGSVLEKNKPTILAEAGAFKTAEVQQCFFVSVVAESVEEACLVVDRFLSQGLANSTLPATMETFGGGGPSIKPFVNSGGKAVGVLSSNLTELVVR